MSPHQPQMFYPVTNQDIIIEKGDIIASRCTINSMEKTKVTLTGLVMKFIEIDVLLNFLCLKIIECDTKMKCMHPIFAFFLEQSNINANVNSKVCILSDVLHRLHRSAKRRLLLHGRQSFQMDASHRNR